MTALAKAIGTAPDDLHITPREIEFEFSDDSPRYWYGKDAFKTHFYNALFTLFPPGEDFFVRSVLHYRGEIDDAVMQEEINNFASQEGLHSRCHADHLDILERQGYTSLKRENKLVDGLLHFLNRKTPR
ncbi:MAG: metal-dependent hydrolase, partial [Pseudomonadales bacterium]|nr:metal-dependent hydrolase [Pseudomonadales bacterium]